jgi:3-hydroxybutyryl-CoA dehydrogenase
MGRCISICLARAGIKVVLCARTEALSKQAMDQLEASLDDMIRHFAITEQEKKIYLSVIESTADLSSLDDVDLVMECVYEDLDAKKSILRQLDNILQHDKMIATNTSILSISDLASATYREPNIIGIHFISTDPNSTLVELVSGKETSSETVSAAKDLVKAMRKEAIEVFEYPGYVSSRLVIPFINEALYILMEGVATAEDIDKAMTLGHNFPMGPLELADTIGLDQVLRMMEALFGELGELKYRPCPLLRKLVRGGMLGRKTSVGIFEYENGQRGQAATIPTQINN